MDSQKKQQFLEDVQSELSNHLDNSDPNSIDSKSAVKKQEVQAFAMAFKSKNSASLTCGVDDDGNLVCKE